MQNKIKPQQLKTLFLRTFFVLLLIAFSANHLSAQVKIRPDDRQDYALEANTEFNHGNWEAGKKIVDDGLKKYPKDSDLRMLLGKYYFQHQQQLDKARYELVKALEQNPDNVDAKQILVNVETEAKRYSSAICYVNELLEVNPYWRGLWRKKIELYRLQGNTIEANRLLKRINQIYPEDTVLQRDYVYETEMSALALQKAGKIDESIALRSELINQEPTNIEHYIGLVNDYIKAGDIYNALAYIDRALVQDPNNIDLIGKKTSLLSEQKRHGELLAFLQQKMRTNASPSLRNQYNYYLLEAARDAKDSDPGTLYAKILEGSPGNDEAFNYVFTDLIARQQYEEALRAVNRYKAARGESKTLLLRELNLHKRMGNTGRASTLTRQLFGQYSNDTDLRDEYVKIVFEEAKNKMAEERYRDAIEDFREILQYGDADMVLVAQHSIYNATMAQNDYNGALDRLNDIISEDPNNPELYVKRAEVYQKQKRYPNAFSAYEQAISLTTGEEKLRFLGGYADMATLVIKEMNDESRYDESLRYVKRWLEQDPDNKDALRYAVNLSNGVNNKAQMYAYAKRGSEAHPEDIFFKVKMAEYDGVNPENYERIYVQLHDEVMAKPYHTDLINTFAQVSEDYANHLIKEKMSHLSIEVLDTALVYAPNSKSLKYTKGLAYEKTHQYDSAYYYQSFYEPSPLELQEFKHWLNYLKYKGYKNEVGITHLRSRHGHDYKISSISSIEYSRYEGVNTYIGRMNYAGRETGKGYQLQGEWGRVWNEKTHTRIDAAWANKFFPKISVNASVFRELDVLNGLEGEAGLGFRWPPDNEKLSNLVLGATKELELWRLNVRFHNYMLSYDNNQSNESGATWLFNLSGQARYYLTSPKNYIMAMASVGTAPDVELIDYQLYGGFSGLNTMVGAGAGHMISKTVSAGIMGTWYNYYQNVDSYRNLHNIYLNLNVVF